MVSPWKVGRFDSNLQFHLNRKVKSHYKIATTFHIFLVVPFFGFLFSTLFSILYYSQMESEPYSISTKEATYSKPCLFNEVYRRFGEKSWRSRKRAIYCSNKVNFKWNTKPFWKHPEASTSERGAPVNFYSTWSLLLPVLSSFFFFLFSLLLFYFFISVKIG